MKVVHCIVAMSHNVVCCKCWWSLLAGNTVTISPSLTASQADREPYSCTAVYSLGCLYNVRISGVNVSSLPTMIKTSENMTSLVESDTEPLFGGREKRKCSGRCWVVTSVCIAVSVGKGQHF